LRSPELTVHADPSREEKMRTARLLALVILACPLWGESARGQTPVLAEVDFTLEGGVSGTDSGVEALIRLADSAASLDSHGTRLS
jgi:hypothetical protein